MGRGRSCLHLWVPRGSVRMLPEEAGLEVKAILSLVDETDYRVAVWGVSAFLMTPYTRQFKKVPTPALALNCFCSALEFKWPACGLMPPCLCLCPSHGLSLCCCALFLMDFLSLIESLPPLFYFIRHWQWNANFFCWRTHYLDLRSVAIIWKEWEGSWIFPVCCF